MFMVSLKKYYDGRLSEIKTYANGVLDGQQISFRDDGSKCSTDIISNSELIQRVNFNGNGKICEIKNYRDGKYHGLYERSTGFFFTAGKVRCNFIHGLLDGDCHLLNSKDEIIATTYFEQGVSCGSYSKKIRGVYQQINAKEIDIKKLFELDC